MKICDGKKYQHPELIRGHIYKQYEVDNCYGGGGRYYIAVKAENGTGGTILASLKNGNWWSGPKTPFGQSGEEEWEDVTDKVCLDVSGLEE